MFELRCHGALPSRRRLNKSQSYYRACLFWRRRYIRHCNRNRLYIHHIFATIIAHPGNSPYPRSISKNPVASPVASGATAGAGGSSGSEGGAILVRAASSGCCRQSRRLARNGLRVRWRPMISVSASSVMSCTVISETPCSVSPSAVSWLPCRVLEWA